MSLLYSDTDKALAIQKSVNGEVKLRQIGKNRSTRSAYCKGLIGAKKIKKGRYTAQWLEKDEMLIVKINRSWLVLFLWQGIFSPCGGRILPRVTVTVYVAAVRHDASVS